MLAAWLGALHGGIFAPGVVNWVDRRERIRTRISVEACYKHSAGGWRGFGGGVERGRPRMRAARAVPPLLYIIAICGAKECRQNPHARKGWRHDTPYRNIWCSAPYSERKWAVMYNRNRGQPAATKARRRRGLDARCPATRKKYVVVT